MESFTVWSMSETDIWSVFIVSVPVPVLFCLSGVLFDAGVVLSLVSRGLPLPIVPCCLMVGGSGLVSVSSSDWDFLGVLFVLYASWQIFRLVLLASPLVCWFLFK